MNTHRAFNQKGQTYEEYAIIVVMFCVVLISVLVSLIDPAYATAKVECNSRTTVEFKTQDGVLLARNSSSDQYKPVDEVLNC